MSNINRIGLSIIFCLLSFSAWANDGYIVFPESLKKCTSSEQCIIMESDCSGCCHNNAINRALREEAQSFKNKSCEGYVGGDCDCISVPQEARCVDGHCEAVRVNIPKEKWPEWYEQHKE